MLKKKRTKEQQNEPQKKPDNKQIKIDVCKSDLKKILSAHKKFAHQGKDAELNILGCIKFTVKDKELILETTDGCRALVSNLKLVDNHGEKGCFIVSMALASKLSFPKGMLNIVRISTDEEQAEFFDLDYSTTQKLLIKCNKGFPKIEDVLPQKQNFKTLLAKQYIKDLSALKASILVISVDTKKKNAAVLVEAKSEGITSQAILMPRQEK